LLPSGIVFHKNLELVELIAAAALFAIVDGHPMTKKFTR